MQDKCTYEYAIIRVVPKVEREEFFNVGVLLYSKRKKFLGIKYHIDPKKLTALCKHTEIALLQNYLEAWKNICEGQTKGGPIALFEQADRFRWLAAAKSTIIQCSKTHPGLCTDPEKELEHLFVTRVL